MAIRSTSVPVVNVAAGLAMKDGKVFMQLRPPGKPLPGLWEYPGGKIEPGENESEAVEREWHEEVGVAVVVFDYLGVVVFPGLEGNIRISLYTVGLTAQPSPAKDRVWVDPVVAAKSLPCTPSTYLFLPKVMQALGRKWPEVSP